MNSLNKLFDKSIKNNFPLDQVYRDKLDKEFNDFTSELSGWINVNDCLMHISEYELIYKNSTSSTQIPVKYKNFLCYSNLVNHNCFDGYLNCADIECSKHLLSNYRLLLGPLAVIDIDTVNSSKIDMNHNVILLIRYVYEVYNNIRNYIDDCPYNAHNYIDNIITFMELCTMTCSVIKTVLSILKEFIIYDQPNYMLNNKVPLKSVKFTKIPKNKNGGSNQ